MSRSSAVWAVAGLAVLIRTNGIAAEVPPAATWLDLSFSRGAPAASVKLERRALFILRADRDITSLKVELRPAGASESAGKWEGMLVPLPATEEPMAPDLGRQKQTKPVWQAAAAVQRKLPLSKTVRAWIPRRVFQNWLLQVEPREPGAGPVQLSVQATPQAETMRNQWLSQVRAGFDPESTPERVRDLVRHLTDDETQHWTGVRRRQVFLHVWGRMTPEEISAAYPEEWLGLLRPPHRLPNGLHLLLNTPPASPAGGAR